MQERHSQARPRPQPCSVFITLESFQKNSSLSFPNSPSAGAAPGQICHDSKTHYPHLSWLTTRTNPRALLAVSMSPCTGVRMPVCSIFSSVCPSPHCAPPRCSHNSAGLKSHVSIPKLQRHVGRWEPGFMTC